MELNQYVRLFLRWSWLIIIVAAVGAIIAFTVRRNEPDMYEATTKIMIGSFLQASNPVQGDIRTGAELAKTYAELAKTREILQATIDELELNMSTDSLAGMIEPQLVPETSLLYLSVFSTDPELAADIANELANQLVLNSPTNLTASQQETIATSGQQILALTNQIAEGREQLLALIDDLEAAEDETEILRLSTQYDITQSQVMQALEMVAQLQNTISTLQLRTNSIEIVDTAIVPPAPLDKGVINMAILGGVIGALLAALLVLVIGHQETEFQSAQQAASVLSLPVLGTVAQFGRTKDPYSERLITRRTPNSAVAETFNMVQANLLFSANGTRIRRNLFVVTSAGPGEGKSITAANLAVSMATSGLRVLLIDADLRRPRLHEILGVGNQVGLPGLLSLSPGEFETGENPCEIPEALLEIVQPTEVTNLYTITSGQSAAVPAEVLRSERLRDWIKFFENCMDFDVILFDTPPALVVADSSILTANMHANVILVIQAGETSRVAALRAKDLFQHIGAPIKGVVLNKARGGSLELGYGYEPYQTAPAAASSETAQTPEL